MSDGRLYCVRFQNFYFTGWHDVSNVGGKAPCFTVTKEKALACVTEKEASSAREILAARQPRNEFRVEPLT